MLRSDGRTDRFLLGNVVHAIHHTTVGMRPEIPEGYGPLLNSGIVTDPPKTKIDRFLSSGEEFIPGLADAEHIGSLYTHRTVLPNTEDTDERPTIVERDGRVCKIFSGKLGTSVQAADEVARYARSASL